MPKHDSSMERKAADWAASVGVSELTQLTASALEAAIQRESRRLHFLQEELRSVRKAAIELDKQVTSTRELVADMLADDARRRVAREEELLAYYKQLPPEAIAAFASIRNPMKGEKDNA